MTRTQRTWHAWAWALLTPLVLIGLAAGLASRPAGFPPAGDTADGAPALIRPTAATEDRP